MATARTANELASARCTYHADSAKHVISLGCECFAHGSITSASGTLAQVSVGNGCDCLVLQVPWQFHVKHWSALPFVWWLHNYKATFQWVYANCDEPTSIVLLLCSLLAGTICRFLILHACCWPLSASSMHRFALLFVLSVSATSMLDQVQFQLSSWLMEHVCSLLPPTTLVVAL